MKAVTILALLVTLSAYSQENNTSTNPASPFWNARWIAHPTASGIQFGVFHFRKTWEIQATPASFVVHVSADNRYRLFVNGISVATGPAISDLTNWHYETINIAPYLKKGKNCISATVWNFAEYRPFAQVSYETAFLLQGNSKAEEIVNTNQSWKVLQNEAYAPHPINRAALQSYVVVAEGEQVRASKYPWQVEEPSYADSLWPQARPLWFATKLRGYGTDGNWMLTPRSIPLLEEKKQRFAVIRRVEGMPSINGQFVQGSAPVTIPAGTTARILFDQSTLTNAYPTLLVSGGAGASVTLTYAEALLDSARVKGNRQVIDGKNIIGISDIYYCDGGTNRRFAPLHFRTFRYLQLDITTTEQPLLLNDFYSIFTGYPFEENAVFKSNDPSLQKIWETGWRTARLCALDSYVDCPYYEQMQYVGDTRIQALISLYVSGDDRLMKKAINDIAHSAFQDGLTESRYPSRDMQVIPTFSLWWICMLHDYWMLRRDDAFIRSHLPIARNILAWYRERLQPDGLTGKLEWWQFVDWSWPWNESERNGGVPPGGTSGGSSIISLQYAYTLQKAAELMNAFGDGNAVTAYRNTARKITTAVYTHCWDNRKGMLADTKAKTSFSQHANILGVLSDAIPAAGQNAVLEKIIADTAITQSTYYFKFYLFEALKKVKAGDRFIGLLQPWQQMIDLGLSTFAESPEPVRSDCHAWSASPLYEFLSLVCGIQSAAPGFRKIKIEPAMGELKTVEGKIPHPDGTIEIKLQRTGSALKAIVSVPEGVSGTFLWRDKTSLLRPGKQVLIF